MLRVLHLADVHLDTIFASRSESVRRQLQGAIRNAFVSAVDLAIAERLDAVLIAGDLFDGELLSFTTERLILEQAQRLTEARIPSFYATGNHDPSSMRARFARFDWPEGFHVFRTHRPERVEIVDDSGTTQGVVIGAGHESPRANENIASHFPVSVGPVPHIGLLHTLVLSAATEQLHDRYAPCDTLDLRRVEYDYWALGHVHTRQQVDEQANAWYAGNIVGRNPVETGARGALLAHVERGRPALTEFVPLSSVEWYHLRIDGLGSVSDASQLEAVVRQAFDRATQDSAASMWIAVVDLQGNCPLEPDLRDPDRRAELEEILAEALPVEAVEIRTSGLSSPIDSNSFRGQPHLIGETLGVIAEMREQDELLSRVGPDPVSRPVSSEERIRYLRTLLNGLEEEAIRRLLVDEKEG